ncbi:MAG: glycosyl hydrolase, partial [Gemmatimonadetes bacterium]|nr:glycosyl hydrolase [Gemmatimonadota bacterium]
ESMHFTPASQRDFIKRHLGPRLRDGGHAGIRLLAYDQNRDHLEEWADVVLSDAETAEYTAGMAIHWYSSTYKVYEDALDRVHARFPDHSLIHTEGCIDDLGKDAPGGIADPVRFKESGWFGNDAFWWNANATDWAYTASWAPKAEDHPIYTPVHRYARDIIVGLDHWVSGWVDWNIVLDRNGGPNHAGNFCGAPVMIDTAAGEVYYTPIFHVLAQLSRTIRPGDRALETERALNGLDTDALHACATVNDEGLLSVQLLNTTKRSITYRLRLPEEYAEVTIPANSVQTVRVRL